ncbi:Replication-relaxation [Sulfobacillus thermosulfidooxidans DSM 9293]|uniref:Replication-relaxation n=2 Tax=Sulfobacillus thermosulfidooxidans TaxID=28034 RepID=A0A1W1WPC9_SULTA|nr:replication-relaxation family protein [Sulfobacillus thermosulfidooxidans]SMC08161.1 Replication-relaxation [Sulfobacillus thermosulfidooxidans DSM 9293]
MPQKTLSRPIRWTPARSPKIQRRRAFSAYTLDFLWTLSMVGYVTIEQAGWIYGAPPRTMFYNIRTWRERGLIQSARISYHSQRTRIVTLAPEGAKLLQEDDDDAWQVLHPHWEPISQTAHTMRMVEHNLDRNTVALMLVRQSQKQGFPTSWDTWQTSLTVTGSHALHIRPDAALRLNGHPVLIELERSWRAGTIQKKLQQYDRLILQGGWRSIAWCNEPPKVLIVPTGANTQKKNFESWLTTFQLFHHSYAWIWPWSQVRESRWTVYGGGGDYQIMPRDLWTIIRQPPYKTSS